MATAVVDIYNAAISAARGKGRLASITDPGREREECDIWYEQVRKQVISAAHWDCCRKLNKLALWGERDTTQDWTHSTLYPEPQYIYMYKIPSDYIHAWHMVDYSHFSIFWSDNSAVKQPAISSNLKDAVLVYAFDNTDPAQWSPGMTQAVIYGLAGHITGALTGNTSLQQQNFQLANSFLLEAQARNANNASVPMEVIPPQFSARGYAEPQAPTRYYYPFGQLFEAPLVNV